MIKFLSLVVLSGSPGSLSNYTGWGKKVSLIIFAITLSIFTIYGTYTL